MMRPVALQLQHHASVRGQATVGRFNPTIVSLASADCWSADLDAGFGRVWHVPGFFVDEASARRAAKTWALAKLGRCVRG